MEACFDVFYQFQGHQRPDSEKSDTTTQRWSGPTRHLRIYRESYTDTDAFAAKDQFAFALHALDKHFKPTVNRSYERYVFRSIRQTNKLLEQFVVHLRYQAENCGFADVDQEIANQVILGTSSSEFCRKILENRFTGLNKIIDLRKLLESVAVQSSQVQNTDEGQSTSSFQSDSVAAVSAQRKYGRSLFSGRLRSCSFCGSRKHDSKSKDCPAKEGTCYFCQAKGHFANRCPQRRHKLRTDKDKQSTVKPKVSVPKSSSSDKKEEVKFVRTQTPAESSDDSDYAFAISSGVDLPEQLRENRVSVKVGGIQVTMLLDSGSSKELFDAVTWAELLKQNVKFCPVEVTRQVFPYGKTRPLDIERAVCLEFTSSLASVWTKAYVLAKSEGRCEPVIGSKTVKSLGILRVGESRKAAEDDVVRQIAEGINVRKIKIGKLKKFQLKLPCDSSVTPIVQPLRRTPFALWKPLKERTDELLKDDIIERVSGATRWVSNIVPSIKKNEELRVCVDMRRANQAVLRERYPIPVFDEIQFRFEFSLSSDRVGIRVSRHNYICYTRRVISLQNTILRHRLCTGNVPENHARSAT